MLVSLYTVHFSKIARARFSQAYAKDKNFQKISKKIFALPFLPKHEMVAAFQYYKTTIADMFQQYPQLSSFFDYVYDFCLKGNISMDRPATLRTTNYCKGWTSQWNAEFQHKNQKFWVVLSKLADQKCKSELNLRGLSRGEKPVDKNRKYEERNKKMTRLKHLYLGGNLSFQQYWDSISDICRKL